ncbi:MAG: response regulator transcription factor [Actinobacteria bacterium]|nr:response regulator transcription factor [Actinomycetota bacterium]
MGLDPASEGAAPLILVVEDDPSYAQALASGLPREGFTVIGAQSGEEALERFSACQPQLLLVDLMLPGMSGLDLCRLLRTRSQVPIIIVTGRDDELDTIASLEAGADDYVTKPFRLRELVARIRASLRRCGTAPLSAGPAAIQPVSTFPPSTATSRKALILGKLRLDPERHEVTAGGHPVELSLKEFKILELLMSNPGRVMTREVLFDRVWPIDTPANPKTLDVHVGRLRAKLRRSPDLVNDEVIETVRGIGYRYAKPSEPP